MIFRVVGTVLLVLLLLAVGLFVLLLFLPARIEVKRNAPDGPLRVRIGFGPVKRVWTQGRKRSKQKKQPQKKQKPRKTKPESPPWVDMKRIDLRQVLSLSLDLIDDMAGTMTWERLHVTVLLHTSDAGETGTLLGALSAMVGNLYPYFARAFVLRDIKIILDADFDAARTIWSVDLSLMTRMGRFPVIMWRRRKALWALWKSIRTTKEERAQWSREHAAPREEDKI